ncbi:MAG: DUF805 domain-containing protein [Alistipes sp.]|nr:DUF805 domain-containing protein [Alistipes sp.]MDE7077343.1 DUF805 domain-containing protein [Alistipes sp.]
MKGQYFDFKGRTKVADFWKFVLVAFVINIVLGIIDGIIGMRLLSGLFGLAILCPMLGIGARRLHDMGKSGWFQLINLIPLVGFILLVYWWCQPSQAEANKWGNAAA